VASLDAFGEVFQSMISASGRIPQLSLVLGPTAGALMVQHSLMSLSWRRKVASL
jgi:acetyl-CoA carboxylase carboxyltransferase component